MRYNFQNQCPNLHFASQQKGKDRNEKRAKRKLQLALRLSERMRQRVWQEKHKGDTLTSSRSSLKMTKHGWLEEPWPVLFGMEQSHEPLSCIFLCSKQRPMKREKNSHRLYCPQDQSHRLARHIFPNSLINNSLSIFHSLLFLPHSLFLSFPNTLL